MYLTLLDLRWLYMANLVTDGNFKMEQSKPKKPQEDVSLTLGTGMMTAPGRYEAHLAVAEETRGVSFNSSTSYSAVSSI